MRTNIRLALLIALAGLAAGMTGKAYAQALTVVSPNQKLALSIALKSLPHPYAAGERAYYQVSFEGQPVLVDSPLGLRFNDAPALDHDFTVTGRDLISHDSSWQDRLNDNLVVRDHYNQLTVHLRESQDPHRRVDLILRAYDAGVAFRYFLPQQEALGKFSLTREETGFYFGQSVSAFAPNLGKFNTDYEREYFRMAVDDIQPTSVIGFPMLVEVPGGPWMALTEADLEDYAGMILCGAPGVEHGVATKLGPLSKDSEEAVTGTTPMATPWRVMVINSQPGGVLETAEDLVLNLNPPCALKDTSWIEPGKAAWDWWSGHYAANVDFKPGENTATLLHFIQFAADHHLPYMLVDGGWAKGGAKGHWDDADVTQWKDDVDLPKLLDFAKERHVKILLWMTKKNAEKQMDVAFPLYEKWGVSGVKVDFMNSDSQETMNLYYRIARKAAEHHLTVDFHGACKPAGMRRTYPNQLTREGVMGMEYNKWSASDTPFHHVILPFTRMLTGPMDYTPGCFNNATQAQFKIQDINPMCQGTRASQLALYVVFFSPLQMVSDYPEIYDHTPEMEFLEQVPTVWDETHFVNGDPGEYLTLARKKDGIWYLGSMTNWTPRDLDIPLDFLGAGTYAAKIFADGPDADTNPTAVKVEGRRVTAADRLSVRLAPGGGLAVIFRPIAPQ